MARKDLAGLAALGALGMMMAKRKGKADMDVDPESADRANAISRGRTNLVDTGMSTPEPGEAPRPNENYGNEGRRTGPIAIGKTPARAAPSRPRLDTSGVSDVDLTGGAASPDQTGGRGVGSRGSLSTETRLGYGGRRFHPEYLEDAEAGRARDAALNAKLGGFDTNRNMPYKKGGVVKMAKGGVTRSSASKRADGIATKGKTRGRYM